MIEKRTFQTEEDSSLLMKKATTIVNIVIPVWSVAVWFSVLPVLLAG